MRAIEYAVLSDTGRVRSRNEDNHFCHAGRKLFIVSDGMGGHVAGTLSSKIVVKALPHFIKQNLADMRDLSQPAAIEKLTAAMAELSIHLWNESQKYHQLAGMGATVVLLMIRGTKALVAHMGDSRAYRFRGGVLERLTHDHSIVQILVDAGRLNPEQALVHPAHHQITRYIGMDGEPLPEVSVVDIAPGDRFLLCTDGLTEMILDPAISSILGTNAEAGPAAQALVDAANTAGGRDNITVVVVNI